ncbi:MAG TPA: tRNA lysidine(34) synthetase TilS [Candidatus Eisenbacteria bacterium]|nr:tRNA lysidine(34) synthetase TilS [Candidatus Eisenbacteria bacterium]
MTTRPNPRDATLERMAAHAISDGGLLRGGAETGAPIVVAVSGGPDSMALLHFMLEWAKGAGRLGRPDVDDAAAPRIVAAHVNHGLRGAESDEDAEFVRTEATSWGAEAVVRAAALPAGARARAAGGAAVEAEARRARYAALREIAASRGADRVLTAHTADDQAETLLLRLVRGAGLRGLAGMAAKSRVQGVKVVRPLLGVSREQVLAYVERHAIPYRRDATNDETAAARNYVRHEIVPRLEARLNPAVRESLLRAAATFREANDDLERRASRAFRKLLLHQEDAKISLDAEGLLLYPKLLQTYVFRRAVRELNGNLRDVSSVHLRALHELAKSHRGHTALLPGRVRVQRERDRVTLSLDRGPKSAPEPEPKPRRAPSKA